MDGVLRKLRGVAPEYLALAGSLAWLLLCVVYFAFSSAPRPAGFVSVVFLLLPFAWIWGWAYFARRCADLDAQIMELRAVLVGAEADTQSYAVYDEHHAEDFGGALPDAEPQIIDPAPEMRAQPAPSLAPEPVIAAPVSLEPEPVVFPDPEPEIPEQHSFDLGGEAQRDCDDLSHADLIRALNFPDDAGDKAGFVALRRALESHAMAQLIQAAQDVLTLLSQNNIFMDDIAPVSQAPGIWRRFASGERGGELVALGVLEDEAPLGVIGQRMRSDTIFRDAAHHFLRRFDKLLCKIEPDLSDEDLIALSETRSARAFICIGCVAGAFDG